MEFVLAGFLICVMVTLGCGIVVFVLLVDYFSWFGQREVRCRELKRYIKKDGK